MKTKGYFAVFGALAALTGLTVLAAEMKLGMTVGLLIALTKASLVGAFFMHLKYEGRFTRFVALAPVAFFLVMLLLILPDFVG
jgi:cytochrome c oxidase subunit 4